MSDPCLSFSLSLSVLEVIYWSSFPFFFFTLCSMNMFCVILRLNMFSILDRAAGKAGEKKNQTICIQRWIKMRGNNTTRSRAQIAQMLRFVILTSQLCMCDVYMKAAQINISMFSIISVSSDGIPVAMFRATAAGLLWERKWSFLSTSLPLRAECASGYTQKAVPLEDV